MPFKRIGVLSSVSFITVAFAILTLHPSEMAMGSASSKSKLMSWNGEKIPYRVALQIGWNLPMDVVGAGVYGGIVKRQPGSGKIIVGDEWPENNLAPPAHNPRHSTGPYLDYSQLTNENRGYTRIARLIQYGDTSTLAQLFDQTKDAEERSKLANLVMTGGARPLHMCGMGRGGDTSELIQLLLDQGANVNAMDNYELTPMDRLASNSVQGRAILKQHGGKYGRELRNVRVPVWTNDEFDFPSGLGES